MYDDLGGVGFTSQDIALMELNVFWIKVTLPALEDGWRGMGLDLVISANSVRHLHLTGSNDFVSEVTFESVLFNFQEVY